VVWRRVAANQHGQTSKGNDADMRRFYRAGAGTLMAAALGAAQAQSTEQLFDFSRHRAPVLIRG
jgi:hypothetical protein